MKSLQNVTKEATLYRGKEITHGIGYSSFMIEHNKLLKKYKRSHSRNSSIGFEIEADFIPYIGFEANAAAAPWDAIDRWGRKWEIRTRGFKREGVTLHFSSSSDAMKSGCCFKGVEEKCKSVDMFLVADTSKVEQKGLLEWWEIPSKVILELYNRDEWMEGKRKCKNPKNGGCHIAITRFLNTMSWLFNK